MLYAISHTESCYQSLLGHVGSTTTHWNLKDIRNDSTVYPGTRNLLYL